MDTAYYIFLCCVYLFIGGMIMPKLSDDMVDLIKNKGSEISNIYKECLENKKDGIVGLSDKINLGIYCCNGNNKVIIFHEENKFEDVEFDLNRFLGIY